MKRKLSQTIFATAFVALAGVAVIRAHAAAVRTDEHPVGAWDERLSWDHPASSRNRASAMAQIMVDVGAALPAGTPIPGGAIVVVKQGSLTVYRSIGSQCEIETYSAGEAFIEQPRGGGPGHQYGHDPVYPFRHLPTCTSGRLPKNRLDPGPGTCPGV